MVVAVSGIKIVIHDKHESSYDTQGRCLLYWSEFLYYKFVLLINSENYCGICREENEGRQNKQKS